MKITTTGQLRSFLADAIEKVANGDMDVHRASQIQKLAGQLTESMYCEVKATALGLQMGRQVAEFGTMQVGDSVTAPS